MWFSGSMTFIRFLRKWETLMGPKKHRMNQEIQWHGTQGWHWSVEEKAFRWEGGVIEGEELTWVGGQLDVWGGHEMGIEEGGGQ